MKAHNPCNIVFEDAHLVVIDKPAGLLTIATEHEKTLTAYHALSMHPQKVPTALLQRTPEALETITDTTNQSY